MRIAHSGERGAYCITTIFFLFNLQKLSIGNESEENGHSKCISHTLNYLYNLEVLTRLTVL